MKSIIISTVISIAICAVGIFAYDHYSKQRIGYIRSGVVLQDYKGMSEANSRFEKEIQMVQANFDTLKNRYDQLLAQEQNIKPAEKAEWGYRLGVAKNELDKYNSQANEQMDARKQELTKGVLQKINVFIQEFGKENNYKLIMGTTNEGSILYGNEGDDLTDVVLKNLNAKYEHVDEGTINPKNSQ